MAILYQAPNEPLLDPYRQLSRSRHQRTESRTLASSTTALSPTQLGEDTELPPEGIGIVGIGIDVVRTHRIVSLVVRRTSTKLERDRPTDMTGIQCVCLHSNPNRLSNLLDVYGSIRSRDVPSCERRGPELCDEASLFVVPPLQRLGAWGG
jgi:hypothetical protein